MEAGRGAISTNRRGVGSRAMNWRECWFALWIVLKVSIRFAPRRVRKWASSPFEEEE
jgi:hypothetical protein